MFYTKYEKDDKSREYLLFIECIKSIEDSRISYYVCIGEDFKDKFILNIYKDNYSKNSQDISIYSHFVYGDVIKVKGKIGAIEKLNNPGEFNYKLYLYSNNIYGVINTYEGVEKIEYTLNFIQRFFKKVYLFKENINQLISKSMEEKEASIVQSLVYGNKENLDEELKLDFSNVGISHLMSVSGTHITSLIIIINLLLNTSNKKKRVIKSLIHILFILLYIIFTGFTISCVRAGLMAIISVITKLFKRKNNIFISLVISLIFILVWNPFSIFSSSFILSYISVVGIILFNKYIKKSIYYVFRKFKIKNIIIKKSFKYVISSISITLSVNLVILPIQISLFNKIVVPQLTSNVLMGLLSFPIRLFGVLGVFTSFIPQVSCLFLYISSILAKLFLKVLSILNLFSITIPTKSMSIFFFVLYYIMILFLFLRVKIKYIIRYIKITKKETKFDFIKIHKHLKIITTVLFFLLIIYITFTNIYSKYFSKYVYFFNVEQGEMSYVKYEKSSVIVDIGSLRKSLPFSVINSYFKSENINHVDVLVISHMDIDHMSGLEDFVKKYHVGLVLYPLVLEKDSNYLYFEKILLENNLNSKEVKANDIIELDSIKIEVLLPGEDLIKKDSKNANSLICIVSTKDSNILYTSDVNKETEEKLILLYNKLPHIDILKVAHHGSKTSSSEEFIKFVAPKYGVISASKRYYGHPNEETINTLKDNNVLIFLTEKIGAIKFNLN